MVLFVNFGCRFPRSEIQMVIELNMPVGFRTENLGAAVFANQFSDYSEIGGASKASSCASQVDWP